jgi:hypothetical protein
MTAIQVTNYDKFAQAIDVHCNRLLSNRGDRVSTNSIRVLSIVSFVAFLTALQRKKAISAKGATRFP